MKFEEKSESSNKQFSRAVYDTLSKAYRPYRTALVFALFLGLAGRILILGQANII